MELTPIPEAENTMLEASVVHQELKLGKELSNPVCKICLGAKQPLSLPCQCKGSMAYVHDACLSKWINIKGSDQPMCELCKQPYNVTVQRFRLCSLRNILQVPSCYFVPFILACAVLLVAVLVLTSSDLGNSTNLGSFIGCLVALMILAGALVRILQSYRKKFREPRWTVVGGADDDIRKDESISLRVNIEPVM